MLGRAVDTAALARFDRLLTVSGAPRSQVASVVLHSNEYRQNNLIVQDFRHYLRHDPCRPATPANCTISVTHPATAETQRFVTALRGELTDEELLGALAGSAAYYQGAGGTDDAFVTHLIGALGIIACCSPTCSGGRPTRAAVRYWPRR